MKLYCCAGQHPQPYRRQQPQHTLQQTILAAWSRSRVGLRHVHQGLTAVRGQAERQAHWGAQR